MKAPEELSLQVALLGGASDTAPRRDGSADAAPAAESDSVVSDGGTAATAPAPLAERAVAAMEVYATESRPGDHRTVLTPLADLQTATAEDEPPWPLATVAATLGATRLPAVCQTLLRPLPDWSRERDHYEHELRHAHDETVVDRLLTSLEADPPQARDSPARADLPASIRSRLEALEATDPARSFAINTRAVAFADPATDDSPRTALADCADAFTAVSGRHYALSPAVYPTDSRAARHCRDELAARTLRGVTCGRELLGNVWPVSRLTSAAQPRIRADVATAGAFCLLGGATLPAAARRALATKSADRVPKPLPPADVLDAFRGPGLQLGWPTDTNGTVRDDDPPLRLPPALQRRHVCVLGTTGAGKSRHGINAHLPNHAATDGATIFLEVKDGRFAEEYCRAHYHEYGTLEDVYRFPAHEILPAAPVFDIGPELDAGMSREQAVQTAADRLVKVLKQSLGREAFEQAFTAEHVITTITKALYDHVHGADQVTVHDIQAAITRLQERETPPPVADEHLRRELSALLANNYDTFTEIMRGAARRLAMVAADARVRPLFAYEPDAGEFADVDPFDWRATLDEDCVVILDLSQLEPEPTETLALVLLSQVWHALRRRARERASEGLADNPPLVNLHIEEAADVAVTGLVRKFLKEGRGYGVAVSLSMQYLEQLRAVDEAAAAEVLNDVGTLLVGPIGHDRRLAERLAGSDVPADAVAHRLGALQPGEWLCWLASDHDVAVDGAFTVAAGPQPPGIAEGPAPLAGARATTY